MPAEKEKRRSTRDGAEHRLSPIFKYEADLDLHFGDEIAATPGGGDLFSCIQCGTCSGTCPISMYMDHSPRKIIAMTRAGFKDEVLHSFTIWQCASCYACTVECPRQIKICELMSVLKQRSIQEGVYPRGFAAPILAQDLFESIRKHGRNNEIQLAMRLYAKTNPLALLKQPGLGLGLMRTGRMKLTGESIKGIRQLDAMLAAADGGGGDAR